jgi:hypothetical protein
MGDAAARLERFLTMFARCEELVLGAPRRCTRSSQRELARRLRLDLGPPDRGRAGFHEQRYLRTLERAYTEALQRREPKRCRWLRDGRAPRELGRVLVAIEQGHALEELLLRVSDLDSAAEILAAARAAAKKSGRRRASR